MREPSTTNRQRPAPNCGKTSARRSKEAGGWMWVVGFWLLSLVTCAADDFGDISVSASAIYTGNTFHGYAETRVMLGNRSDRKTHIVTLVYPNRPFNNGNSIGRLSRTVSLAPDVREVVSLLQPPLPAQGDGSIRVEVDGRHEGEIHAPNANNHCNFYSRGGQAATVFISRSLDYRRGGKVISSEPRRVHGGDGRRSAGFHFPSGRLSADDLDARYAARRADQLAGTGLCDAANREQNHHLQHPIANHRRLNLTGRHFRNQSRHPGDVVRHEPVPAVADGSSSMICRPQKNR